MVATAQQQTDLVIYGGRDEVKELGARLQNYMPNAQKFTHLEAQAVAQIAVAHGLDPFNGEVWGIKGENGVWYGVMVGIKGLRKAASRQAKEEGSHYWTEPRRVDPEKYNEPPNAIVYEIILRDYLTITTYSKSIRALTDGGIPYADAREMIGPMPQVIGVGIARPDERSKMKIHHRAMKRAEADAIKKRYNVSFGSGVMAEGDKIDDEVQSIADALDGEATTIDGIEKGQREADTPQLLDVDKAYLPSEPESQLSEYEIALTVCTPKGNKLGELNDSELEHFLSLNNSTITKGMKDAASVILNKRITNAQREASNLTALGF